MVPSNLGNEASSRETCLGRTEQKISPHNFPRVNLKQALFHTVVSDQMEESAVLIPRSHTHEYE